jgi:hypothetical protein
VKYSLVLLSLLGIIGCSPKSKELSVQKLPPEEKVEIPQYDPITQQEFNWITIDGGQSSLDFNPRIDILFVIDNSESMESAQRNLKLNIDKFTSGIIRNKMIDFHIGIISTWDNSNRALNAKQESDPKIGEFRNVQDSKGKFYSQKYLSRNTQELITSSINIGIQPFSKGGPEIEEFFSPLMAAIEKTGHGAANENFFRDDAQLVVILMTDADDSSSRISPEQMAQSLLDFKKGDGSKLSVYGVLVRPQDEDRYKDWDLRIHPKYHPECFDFIDKRPINNGRCSGFGPDRLEQFIISANTNSGTPEDIRNKYIMAITSPNFGTDLSRIGSDITIKTLEKNIYLPQRPRYEETSNQIMIRVRYGTPNQLSLGKGQLIPRGDSGWLYNPKDNSIHLSGHIKYNYTEGSRFAVDIVPLTLKQ